MPTKKQEIGDKYEDFSKQILLLTEISWEDGIVFDKNYNSENDKIEGASGAKHQIDIHLVSSQYNNYHLLCECKCHKGSVEKTEACSFVTVIMDIKKKNPDWNVIACFTSNLGFQKGAVQILLYYDIAPLDLEDVSEKEFKITITESSISPKIEITKVYLKNNEVANCYDGFINDDRGGVLRPQYLLGYYELLDENNNIIDDLIHHYGFFKTGNRKHVNNEFDVFKSLEKQIELDRIEGIAKGPCESGPSTSTSIIKSDVKAVLKLSKDTYYHFKKDGTIEKKDFRELKDRD